MLCPLCQAEMRKFGKNPNGSQRYRCDSCRKSFTDPRTRPQDRRRLDPSKMLLCLRMLLEGNSIRSVERLTRVHRDTIIDAMVAAGEKCHAFLANRIKKISVDDVECDEVWGYVWCKEKYRVRRGYGEECGDAYCFTAFERTSKLLITWHLGKRTPEHAAEFARKLAVATTGRFQLTTDGFKPYRQTIRFFLGNRVDFAQLVKVYGRAQDDDHNYTPPQVVDCYSTVVCGEPEEELICTSHVERHNKTMRMQIRRMTRLTDGHSKKWENHEAALALFFAYYNFCRVHSTLAERAREETGETRKTTPAMAAGLTEEMWSLERLLEEANRI
jgi:transposase-like protein/IS1 family transposase